MKTPLKKKGQMMNDHLDDIDAKFSVFSGILKNLLKFRNTFPEDVWKFEILNNGSSRFKSYARSAMVASQHLGVLLFP